MRKFKKLCLILGAIRSVSVSPNSKFIASTSFDETVRVWTTRDAQCLHVLEGTYSFYTMFVTGSVMKITGHLAVWKLTLPTIKIREMTLILF